MGRKSGFTIVELLIVIVIIAILAAITVVAYNGIQDRAKASAASQALANAVKKIKYWQVEQDSTLSPTSLATAGITDTASVSYQYNPGTTGDYCITATVSGKSYKIDSTTSQSVLGGCPGHGQGGVAAITNLVTNPNLENNETGWGAANAATITRQSSSAIFGSQGLRVVAPSNNIDSGVGVATAGGVTAGTSYTASVSIRAITAGQYRLSIQGTGSGPGSGGINTSLAANQTMRFVVTWTPTTSGSIAFYALRGGGQAGTHSFDVDGAMLVQASNSSNYADGNSPDWTWNGNNTSTGPPL